MNGCMACELTSGERELPGGVIQETAGWVVEHCVGPLGVGTLVIKPKRHLTHIWELTEQEALELGPLMRLASIALDELLAPEQVYATLWSHAGGTPVHIHWVLQPVGADRPKDLFGPHLQVAMFDRGEAPRPAEIETVASELRVLLNADADPHAGEPQ
jgi:diadenosine tetraphosphate (Ap4A) HIT family hydrolase